MARQIVPMTDEALEQILRSALVAAGASKFWHVVAKLKNERVNPDRGKKMLFKWHVIRMAYQRQKGICSICRDDMALDRSKIEGDHFDPNLTEEQGLNRLDNCRAVHVKCNREKGSKTPSEVAKWKGKTLVEVLGDES